MSTVDDRIERLVIEENRIRTEITALRNGTLPWLEEHGQGTARELAEARGISHSQANNQLIALVDVGLAVRDASSLPGGGWIYTYYLA